MTEPPPKMSRHEGADESIQSNSGNIAHAKIEERIGLLFAVMSLIVSAMMATYVFVKVDNLRDAVVKAETECGVLNDEVHEIKGALHGK